MNVIFRAGTTEELAGLVQGGVDLRDKNAALRVALQTALGPQARWAEGTTERPAKNGAARANDGGAKKGKAKKRKG